MGLEQPDDILLTSWNCSIIGPPGTTFEGRIISVHVEAGPQYPDVAPSVRFVSRVNLDCVDPSGAVNCSKVPALASWAGQQGSIEQALMGIRQAMMSPANRRLPQPSEDATY